MAKCPECGADNPEGATFCGLCAGSFKERDAAPRKPVREKWSSLDELAVKGRGRRSRALIWGVSIFAVIAVAVIAGILINSRMEKAADGRTEYASKYSGITFKYPSSWEKKDFDYLRTMNKGEGVDPRMGNEIILMKRGNAIYRHLLIVSSMESPYQNQSWPDIKNAIESGAQQAGPENRTDISFINLGLPPSTGANGIGTMYTLIPQIGPKLFQLEALILKGGIVYTLALTTPLKGGGSDEGEARSVFTELLQSISFR